MRRLILSARIWWNEYRTALLAHQLERMRCDLTELNANRVALYFDLMRWESGLD